MAFTSLAPYAIPFRARSFPPVTPSTAEDNFASVFQGLRAEFGKIESLNFITSGYNLSSIDLPYGILFQLSNAFVGRDSQLQRFEKGIYRFSAFSESFDELYTITQEIENQYNWSRFNMNDTFMVTDIIWTGNDYNEEVAGLYRSNITFEIGVQKAPNVSNIQTRTTGDNFLNAIKKRADQFSLSQFNTTKLGLATYDFEHDPYIVIGNFHSNEYGRTSNTQQQVTMFPIEIFDSTLDGLEAKMLEVDEIFDLATIVIKDKWTLVLEWLGSEITEMIPGVFRGKLNFQIVTEKSIVVA